MQQFVTENGGLSGIMRKVHVQGTTQHSIILTSQPVVFADTEN